MGKELMPAKKKPSRLLKALKITAIVFLSLILLIVLAGIIICTGYIDRSKVTMEEHIKEISERIEEKYMPKYKDFTSYSVYPVYDENEEVYCYLVEFEPEGFMYVHANEKVYFTAILGTGGPYTRNTDPMNGWTEYRLEKNENGEMERVYETDENGESVRYLVSPFKMAKIKNERLYLLSANLEEDGCRFPAVKRGDKYVNVISMEEMDYTPRGIMTEYPFVGIFFITIKASYDL